MATSSERSPPPFPDSEDQDVLDAEEVRGRDSDEEDADDDSADGGDLFTSAVESAILDTADSDMDPTPLPPVSQPIVDLMTPPDDIMDSPLFEPFVTTSQTTETIAAAIEVVSEPSDDFVDLTNNLMDSPDSPEEAAAAFTDAVEEEEEEEEEEETSEIPLDEPAEEFVDIMGSETEALQEEVVVADVTVEAATVKSEVTSDDVTDPPGGQEGTGSHAEEEPAAAAGETSTAAPVIDLIEDLPASNTQEPLVDVKSASNTQEPPVADKTASDEQPPAVTDTIVDPLVDFLSDVAPAIVAAAPAPAPTPAPRKPSRASIDLFEDDGNDLFTEPLKAKSAKQPQKNLFGEADEDLFGEPLGATAKKSSVVKEHKEKHVTIRAPGDGIDIVGPLQDSYQAQAHTPADIFTEEALTTTAAPSLANTSTVNPKTNGVHSEEENDLFAEATVELSLDSPQQDERKKDVTAKPSVSAPSALAAAASLSMPQSAALEELDEEEEEEQADKFDIVVSVKDPEKIGDGMNAYMAYKVSTQTSLLMFRNQKFTVRRRFSDFLGLYEKLSEKHGPNGYIVPPPPEKSILGMTKMKVGKEDSSSNDFVERRRGALERYLQRVVDHPSLLQDPDVREFLEREELPRATSTQALSGAGFLKMLNKATDSISKMTIKMNESDVWFEEKLQEVESADQQFRKLHALVESLVIHRKELSLNTASFAKSTAMLGSAEDNTALSRALSQLAEVEDKMEQLHQDQAANDTFSFAEVIADYIRLLGAVRGSFDHRMKSWQRWQDAQAALQKKRETEAKLLWANKPDKLQLAKEEIAEWEAKVTQYEREFERVSATVRKEVVRFEKEKTKNFKRQIVKYLEGLLQSQHQLIKYWEAFLPEAKAIA